jgi:hypothetical protein
LFALNPLIAARTEVARQDRNKRGACMGGVAEGGGGSGEEG